jgi:hypothetical protein
LTPQRRRGSNHLLRLEGLTPNAFFLLYPNALFANRTV